jgi:hypothetical protein
MNRNVVAIILIIAAAALLGVYAWPRLKPYFVGVEVPTAVPGSAQGTTVPI